MIVCDWCGQAKGCLQKETDGREFDICADCWHPIEEKLKGKGRQKLRQDMVFLPQQTALNESPMNQKGRLGHRRFLAG